MLRFLFRFILLPLFAILIIGYAAIPFWAPIVVKMLLPNSFNQVKITLGYPSHNTWRMEELNWQQTYEQGTYEASLNQVELGYSWQTLQQGQWPLINITNASASIKAAPQSLSNTPGLALLPSQWLKTWPVFSVARFNLDITADGESYAFSGQMDNTTERLNVLSKISMPMDQNLYLDATLKPDDQVEAKLFSAQSTSPVAKLTSLIKRKGSDYIWQGQGAVNLAYGQTMLAHVLPLDFSETRITQGKVNSHWKINLPQSVAHDAKKQFSNWLASASGELQSQIQVEASNPNVKNLFVDASLTQVLNQGEDPQWRLNQGSTMRVTPVWDNTKIDPTLYQSLLLEQAQLTFSADTPIIVERLVESNLLGTQSGLAFKGDINATLENTHSVYQVFGQLTDLQVNNLNHWQGLANLSGYYIAEQGKRPWMQQLPLDLRQLQFLTQVKFDFDPKQWQFEVSPNSKISATQVVSRREAGTVQLFASDKLNLSNQNSIRLNYLPDNDYWSWSNFDIHLKPESIPSQGLEVTFKEGSSMLTNRPLNGEYKLLPTLINLPKWPSFQAISSGKFSWFDEELKIDFSSKLPPFSEDINGSYTWRANDVEHALNISANKVDLASLVTSIRNDAHLFSPVGKLLNKVTNGQVDYSADWQWGKTWAKASQALNYSNVDLSAFDMNINSLNGRSLFEYSVGTKNAAPDTQPKVSLEGSHKLKAKKVSFSLKPFGQLLNVATNFQTKGENTRVTKLNDFSAQWLGGTLSTSNAAPNQQASSLIIVDVKELALKNLVALSNSDGITATGQLSGTVTMTLDSVDLDQPNIDFDSASLSSTGKGTIVYQGTSQASSSAEAQYLQEILSQFDYDSLSAKVYNAEDGNLELITQIKGSNKAFQKGQSVDFSLTLTPTLR